MISAITLLSIAKKFGTPIDALRKDEAGDARVLIMRDLSVLWYIHWSGGSGLLSAGGVRHSSSFLPFLWLHGTRDLGRRVQSAIFSTKHHSFPWIPE